MKGRYLIHVAIAVAFAGAVWFGDPFLLMILVVGPLVWIGLPACLVAVILLLVATRTGRSRRPALTILFVVAAFGCIGGLAIPANHFIQQRAVDAAKGYPA